MKKVIKYSILSIILLLPLSLLLTSCSDDNSPEDFNEYQIKYKRELILKAIEDIKAQRGDDTLIRIHVGGIEMGHFSLSNCSVEGDYFLVGELGKNGRYLVTKYVGYSLSSIIEGTFEKFAPGIYFE
ncbi:MAG: hypothetical protein ACTTKN_09245 [Phocaeicola sp.]|uniref:hypothetical protein n=1 Tax=Phocaeicola sp. TaxID=2773926 RepID=UPI003FA0685A